ncbi:putative molybdenum cofactor guanylyltransferase [Spirochaetia bacterium]|nr:putative molybdenum cofactor guanylyltransferase [Spirochaetia bacterium]
MNNDSSFGSALVLAGGIGSRIGYDKKNLEIAGEKLIDRTINTLSGVFDEIIVSSNNEFVRPNILTLKDKIGAGPLAGIYQGLTHCKSDYLFVIACDMPFLSVGYIRFLQEKLKNRICDAAVTRREDGFLEPFNSFYNKSCTVPIMEALRNESFKILPLLKKLNLEIIPPEEFKQFEKGNLFFNINYKEDLEKAGSLIFQ